MPKITFKCSCGDSITYEIDPESIENELKRVSIVPILISHKDHFITAYVDHNYQVRSVERIILVKDDESSVVVKTSMDKSDIISKVEDIKKKKDPSKEFLSFLSLLLSEIKEPENLFIAGRKIGKYLWNKRREPMIKLGASFKVDPTLVLKNEISPIYKDIVKIKNLDSEEKTIVIRESISPQLMIGIAQGILDAISDYMEKKIDIALEYQMSGGTVFLTLQ
ncbi:MAG: hypothetical protein BAJALOKI2v1_340025 [Promethearchaeota archaeon]|nr:MAG: hypothetical protein BAJALOKI2v1_340025 [Candidatus Lokiarchaeota archaeon]